MQYAAQPNFFLFSLLLVSPFIGSFVGVLIERVPSRRPLFFARSACDHCGAALNAIHLLPLVSWFTLRGRCAFCSQPIARFYLGVELASVAVVVWASTLTDGVVLMWTCIFGWILLALAWIDWRTMKLPNSLTLSLFATGLFAAWWLVPDQLADHFFGAGLGFVVFWAVALAYKIVRKHDGIGRGDAKLLAGLGIWVSWTGLPTVVLYGAAAACLYVLISRLSGNRFTSVDKIPFGTFLALGGWLVWLYGPLVSAGQV